MNQRPTRKRISENQRPSAANRRGGRRPGAGAPKGNLNALKHGAYSRRFAHLGALVASSPAACEALLRLVERHQQRRRAADEVAAHILAQIIARGLVRGRDRLILLPPVGDADSINLNSGPQTRKNRVSPWDNQSPGTKTTDQSKLR